MSGLSAPHSGLLPKTEKNSPSVSGPSVANPSTFLKNKDRIEKTADKVLNLLQSHGIDSVDDQRR